MNSGIDSNPDVIDQPNVTASQLVDGIVGLVSLPEVCIRISEMVDDPFSSANEIGKVISQDASLTARLLKIVNSAFYRFPARIETVSRAITIVGYRELRDLVLAATVAGIFEKVPSSLIDIDSFWRHGIYTGIVSRIIAKKCRVLHNERLFIAGLLHDIGRLIIAYKMPNYIRQALIIAEQQQIPVHEAEKKIMGFDHAEVGAELMKTWRLPESHWIAARYHHQPQQCDHYNLEVSIVYLANQVTEMAESGEFEAQYLNNVDESIWQTTRINHNDIEQILVEAREQFIDALSLFRPKGNVSRSGPNAA